MRKSVLAGAKTPAVFLLIFLLLGVASLSRGWAADPNLDERLADLETAVAHSGNRGLSLTVYGQVNRALLFWDDGIDSGMLGVDNHTSSSRLGFVGRAELRPGWIAGYRLEFEAAFPSSHDVFNGFNACEDGILNVLQIRQNYWDITHKDLGRVAVGFQSPATDDITIINLGSQMNDAAVHYNNAFQIRLGLGSPPIVTDLTWGQIAHNIDSFRGNFVRYDTPIMRGLLFSAAWNHDVWDVALRSGEI